MDKSPDAFRTISEVAEDLDLPQHVLRFWETRFSQIKPLKRGGGRRYYRPDDVDLLRGIRHLLYGKGYTIKGVQRIIKDEGVRFVQAAWKDGAPSPPAAAADADDLPSPHTQAAAVEAKATAVAPAPRSWDLETTPASDILQAQTAADAKISIAAMRRLQAILYDLDESRRVLAAARSVDG